MCGIAGFVGLQISKEEAAFRVRKMCDAIKHRGPDADGYHIADGVALGMRRLSIIDVGGGRQPIYNEDESIAVVFNGEIYNHHILRQELEASGHHFRTNSDTEVLVHLYEDFGSDMVTRLNGMFAFAIWDSRDKSLLVARDRSGMKPLSYLESPDGLVFCSELRSLYVLQPESLRVSPAAVMQYLAFGYVPDPGSIFEGVKKLPPGHLLTWNREKGTVVHRYWMPPVPEKQAFDEKGLIEVFRAKLDDAVALHLESEVPLGAFLSGGLDSSLVVALMGRHASGRVRTFSIGFAEEKYDESAAARAVAKELGTDHSELILGPNIEEMFESIAAMFDEPFADASAIPTFAVAQLARQSVTVVLSGDGGDELFGGYSRYQQALRHRVGDVGRLSRALSALALTMPHMLPGRNRLTDLGRSWWGRYSATLVQPLRLDEGGVARADQPGGSGYVADQLNRWIPSELGDDFAAAMMQVDFQTYLTGDILTKVDRTSMAVSLEARVPLLDCDLIDFALQIPGSMRVTPDESKRLFRQAIKGIVPESVLSRPKRGFGVPLGLWFRGPLHHRIKSLLNPSQELRQYVEIDAVRRLVSEHTMGRRDHSALLWRLIVLDCWLTGLKAGRLGHPPVLPPLLVDTHRT